MILEFGLTIIGLRCSRLTVLSMKKTIGSMQRENIFERMGNIQARKPVMCHGGILHLLAQNLSHVKTSQHSQKDWAPPKKTSNQSVIKSIASRLFSLPKNVGAQEIFSWNYTVLAWISMTSNFMIRTPFRCKICCKRTLWDGKSSDELTHFPCMHWGSLGGMTNSVRGISSREIAHVEVFVLSGFSLPWI